jgi:hypothetical protein
MEGLRFGRSALIMIVSWLIRHVVRFAWRKNQQWSFCAIMCFTMCVLHYEKVRKLHVRGVRFQQTRFSHYLLLQCFSKKLKIRLNNNSLIQLLKTLSGMLKWSNSCLNYQYNYSNHQHYYYYWLIISLLNSIIFSFENNHASFGNTY